MNQVFDFKRWLLLVGKHWSENRKKYLLSMVAMVALMVIWYSFMLIIERFKPFPIEMQVATYYIGMGIVGCLFGSLLFADLASGPKAMHYLSIPASTLEKLLTALLYGVVLFFVCYTVIFYLVDFIMVEIGNNSQKRLWIEQGITRPFKPMEVVNVFTNPSGNGELPTNFFYYVFLIYFNLQAAFILGSVYFPAYSFVKTCITLLIVFLFFVFLIGDLLDGFLPRGGFAEDFFAYRVWEGDKWERGVRLPDWFAHTVKFLFMYGFLPLFWLATYFRLKEKEV